jgi:hypothetical protein
VSNPSIGSSFLEGLPLADNSGQDGRQDEKERAGSQYHEMTPAEEPKGQGARGDHPGQDWFRLPSGHDAQGPEQVEQRECEKKKDLTGRGVPDSKIKDSHEVGEQGYGEIDEPQNGRKNGDVSAGVSRPAYWLRSPLTLSARSVPPGPHSSCWLRYDPLLLVQTFGVRRGADPCLAKLAVAPRSSFFPPAPSDITRPITWTYRASLPHYVEVPVVPLHEFERRSVSPQFLV